MNLSESPAAWLQLVDYENYSQNFPHDENLFTFPEVVDLHDGNFTYQDPSNNPPAQGEVSAQALVSDNTEGTNVGEARKEGAGQVHEVSAEDPRSPAATSTPLIIQHPRAATIPGRTAGWKSCDTCHTRKVSICPHYYLEKADMIQRRCDHGEDGFIDPELAARAHKKKKTKA